MTNWQKKMDLANKVHVIYGFERLTYEEFIDEVKRYADKVLLHYGRCLDCGCAAAGDFKVAQMDRGPMTVAAVCEECQEKAMESGWRRGDRYPSLVRVWKDVAREEPPHIAENDIGTYFSRTYDPESRTMGRLNRHEAR